MKKISVIIVLATCAWSLSACTNRNKSGHDNNNFRDTLDQDTISSPPIDTTNQSLDTTTMGRDSTGLPSPQP